MTIVLRNTSKVAVIVRNRDNGKKLSVGPGVTISGEGYRKYAKHGAFSIIVDKKPDMSLTNKAIAITNKERDVRVIRPRPENEILEVAPTPTNGTMLGVGIPPGIGDISWIHSKLVTLNRPIHYLISRSSPARAAPYCMSLTNVEKVSQEKFSYAEVLKKSINPLEPFPEDINQCFLELNTFLEKGNRLEDAFPGMQTDFHYQWKIEGGHRITADRLARSFGDDVQVFGIYTSSWGPVRAWRGWKPQDWVQLIKLWQAHFTDAEWIPALIGADFDAQYMTELRRLLDQEHIKYIPVIGYHIGVVIALLNRYIRFLMGFPSGICIISNVCYVPTYMQYPNKLDKLRYAWQDPNVPYRAEVFKPVEATWEEVREMADKL